MSQTKHTQGPWYATTVPFELATTDSVATVWKDNVHKDGQIGSQIVADISRCVGYEQAEANAKLIAAAPEMLAALERWQDEWEVNGTPSQSANNYSIELQIQAAIAKAKGI